MAKLNALKHQVNIKFIQENCKESISGYYDIFVSNPPYIRTDDIPNLMRDVAHHEPSLALDGGNDGLDAYRHIINEAPAKLKAGGLLAFEIGYDQADDLKKLLKDSGNFTPAIIVKDLAEHDRVVLAHRL